MPEAQLKSQTAVGSGERAGGENGRGRGLLGRDFSVSLGHL